MGKIFQKISKIDQFIGKEHALAIGKTLMSTEDITKKNKGIGVECYHYLNDGLWNMKGIKA